MVFYIFDQGARLSTPVDSILRPRTAEPVAASDRLHPVRAHEQHEIDSVEGEYLKQQSVSREPAVFSEQIMSRQLVTLQAMDHLDAAWQLIANTGFRHFPVLGASGALVGMLSDRDLYQAAASQTGQSLDLLRVSDLMAHQVITAAAGTEIRLLAEVMVARRLGAIPVVDGEKPIGIVSRSDILRALVNRAPLEIWT